MAQIDTRPAKLDIIAAAGDDLSVTLTTTTTTWLDGETLSAPITTFAGASTGVSFTTSWSAGTLQLSLSDTDTGTTLGEGRYKWALTGTEAGVTTTHLAGVLQLTAQSSGSGSTSVSGTVTVTAQSVALTVNSSALGSIEAHLADTVDAHDASAISVLDTGGYYTGTDTETALAELGASRAAIPRVLKILRQAASLGNNGSALTAMASPPTITYSTSATLARVWAAQGVDQDNIVGTTTATYLNSSGKIQNAGKPFGHEFDFYGQNVEFGWAAESSATTVWIWVDDQPVTTGPTAPGGVTISAGTFVWGKLAFASTGFHRIRVWINACNAILYNTTDVGGVIIAAPQRPKIGIVGDSFTDSSAGVGSDKLNSWPTQVRLSFAAEIAQLGVSGSGYVSGGSNAFGNATRVSQMADFAPDLLVFVGSVNDDSNSATVASAATACWDAYVAAMPGTPIIVFGPQPSSSTATVSANRASVNKALRDAAVAHSSVIAYHDMIGNATDGTVPSTWSSGTTYATGDLAVYQGSIWKYTGDVTQTNATAPPQSPRWSLQTACYTGTGNSGSTTGDGNRDVFLYSDAAHPTTAGSAALGRWIVRRIYDTLVAYTTTV